MCFYHDEIIKVSLSIYVFKIKKYFKELCKKLEHENHTKIKGFPLSLSLFRIREPCRPLEALGAENREKQILDCIDDGHDNHNITIIILVHTKCLGRSQHIGNAPPLLVTISLTSHSDSTVRILESIILQIRMWGVECVQLA